MWTRADALLFLRGRLRFYRADGTPTQTNCGGASVLVAYGGHNADRLRTCALGAFVPMTAIHVSMRADDAQTSEQIALI